MEKTAIFSNDNSALRETATRLINALGVEGAIYICRSNYWHGILRLIEAEEIVVPLQPQQHEVAEIDAPARLYSLPQAATRVRARQVESAPRTAIAA